MPGLIINAITQLAYVAMIGGIIFFIGWTVYILYNRHQQSKRMNLMTSGHSKIENKIVGFAAGLGKLGLAIGKKIRER